MKEYGPGYYNKHMERALVKLEKSPWRRLYQRAAKMLPPPSAEKMIADLGSGTGRFAKHLWNLGYRKYVGVDFAGACIVEARRYVPGFTFVKANLFDDVLTSTVWSADVFVALEVLEHIERDLDVLSRIPTGALVILSVPSYPSEAHVRTFESVEQVEKRYGGFIASNKWATLTVAPLRWIFLCCGEKR